MRAARFLGSASDDMARCFLVCRGPIPGRMSGMDGLSRWLRQNFYARERLLDEDEVKSQHLHYGWCGRVQPDVPDVCNCGYPDRRQAEIRAERRDIEAKKQILAWCDRVDSGLGPDGVMAPDARKIRQLLAVPFADEPDFRTEWLPSQPTENSLDGLMPGHVPTNEEIPPQGPDDE